MLDSRYLIDDFRFWITPVGGSAYWLIADFRVENLYLVSFVIKGV
jgi:hypothetical protein